MPDAPHHLIFPSPYSSTEVLASSNRAVIGSIGARAWSRVDLATGALVESGLDYPDRLGDPSLALPPIEERAEETDEGPVSTFSRDGMVRARLPGFTRAAARAGELVAALLEGPLGTLVFIDWPGAPSPSPVITSQENAELAASDRVLAISQTGSLDLLGLRDGALRWVRIGVPDAPGDELSDRVWPIAAEGGRVLIVNFDRLWVVDADALLDEAPADGRVQRREIAFREAWPQGKRMTGTVRFVGTNFLKVEVPETGSVRVTRLLPEPEVAVGESLVLENVRAQSGLLVAELFHHVGAGPAAAPPSAIERLPCPAEPEPWGEGVPTAAASRRTENLQTLDGACAAVGATAPPLLRRLVALADEDPVVVRWLESMLLLVEVGPVVHWGIVDPHLLAFAGLGGGDEHCLYLYPPLAASPPVVCFHHDEGRFALVATSFEEFLGCHLRQEWGEEDHEVRALLCRRLGFTLPDEAPPDQEPPAWLPKWDEVLPRSAPHRAAAAAPAPTPPSPRPSLWRRLLGLSSPSRPAPPAPPTSPDPPIPPDRVAQPAEPPESASPSPSTGAIDPIARERLLVGQLKGGDVSEEVVRELLDLYGELGWDLAAANLRSTADELLE